MTKEHFRIILIFDDLKAKKIIEKILVGKTLKAFGADSGSYWRKKGPEKEFMIESVIISYIDRDTYGFFGLDVYPKDYDTAKDFLYTDDKFENEVQKALPFSRVVFSEQGMQGQWCANFDVTIK